MSGLVRVLLADDSPRSRGALRDLVEAEPGLQVVGAAAGGEEAAALARRLRPDVIAMGLHLLDAEGHSGIARVMAETPTPILVLAADASEAAGFQALSLGALDIIGMPGPGNLARYGAQLRTRLRLLAGIQVARQPRRPRPRAAPAEARPARRPALVALAASLGGPRALAHLLGALPGDFPAPIAVVQHISEGFAGGLAAWLDGEVALEVRLAAAGDRLVAGRVLLAPGGHHLEIEEGRVRLGGGPPVGSFRPSADVLLSSSARAYGAAACGVLLTGMGCDGAAGLRAIRDAGGPTLAQDEGSSAVFGMARAALEAGAVERILPLDEIAPALRELLR